MVGEILNMNLLLKKPILDIYSHLNNANYSDI